jgi:hypothetical protein
VAWKKAMAKEAWKKANQSDVELTGRLAWIWKRKNFLKPLTK